MNDEFSKKREVVKHLLGMLKSNAVGEVEGGLHPETASVEKISKPAMAKGGMVDLGEGVGNMVPCSHDECMSQGGACMYAEGGVVDQGGPEQEMKSDLPSEPGAEHEVGMDSVEDDAKVHDTDIEEEDEENNQSAFSGLMKKRK